MLVHHWCCLRRDVLNWSNLIQWPYERDCWCFFFKDLGSFKWCWYTVERRSFNAVWCVGRCFELPSCWNGEMSIPGLSGSRYCQISARCKSLQAGFWFPKKSENEPLQWWWLQNFYWNLTHVWKIDLWPAGQAKLCRVSSFKTFITDCIL